MAINIVGCSSFEEAMGIVLHCHAEGFDTLLIEVSPTSFIVEYWK